MQDTGEIPPMTPDDFAALAAFAGPIYQESRLIEKFTSDNPIPGGFVEQGSMNIKQGLEQAKKLAQASITQPPRPMYVPPAAPIEHPDIVMGTTSFVPYPQPINAPIPLPKVDDGQLELPFNKSNQDVTNDLLKEISRKLTKVIELLEKKEMGDTAPKQKHVKN